MAKARAATERNQPQIMSLVMRNNIKYYKKLRGAGGNLPLEGFGATPRLEAPTSLERINYKKPGKGLVEKVLIC